MPANIRKQLPKTAVERIEALEHTVNGLIQALNQLMMQTNDRLNATAEVISAVGKHIGTEVVEKLVQEARDEREAERVAAAEKQIRDQLEAGTLKATETMNEKSLVVGIEYDKDGNVVKPGRVQVPFSTIKPALQEKLLNQPTSTRIETEAGTTFEVVEIYEACEPPPPPPPPPPTEVPVTPEQEGGAAFKAAEELEEGLAEAKA